MWRRCLVVALLALAATASVAELPGVGILAMGTDPSAKVARWLRFHERLRELGWRDGENVRVLPRFADGDPAKAEAMLRELVQAKVALIVTTGTVEALAAQRVTSSIPIVMLHVLDPVELGLIQSLARPGGNVTGRTHIVSGLSGKLLELISQMVPSARRAVYGRGATGSRAHGEEISAAAKLLGMAYQQSDLPRDRNFDSWAGRMKRDGVDAAVLVLDSLTIAAPHNANLAAALINTDCPRSAR